MVALAPLGAGGDRPRRPRTQITALLAVLSNLRASRGFGPLSLCRGVPFWSLFLAALTPLVFGLKFWSDLDPNFPRGPKY